MTSNMFKNKKITIMGLGLHGGGVGVVKFFYKQGAKLLITDLKTKSQLKESLIKLKNLKIKFILGKHRKQDFINTDLIIKNPDVASDSIYLKIARENNIPIKTDIALFFDLCKAPIIGITGTKGKSTTATLCYLILKNKYPHTFLAGNIGVSPLEILSKVNKSKNAKVILELSSFELEDLRQSPQIALITNLFPDHLNRYKNFKDYIKAKESIFKYQNRNDILILNYNDPESKKIARKALAKIYFFKGSNIEATLKVAEILKISQKDIKKTLSKFKGIHDRQELSAIKKGVRYINDTTATTPQSVILAINTFKEKFTKSKIILIAGGMDKNLEYKNLAAEIKKNVDNLILLPGSATDKIKNRLGKLKVGYLDSVSMAEAVKIAENIAQKGDLVLLSPGAASFNLFKNEFHRGEEFKKEVNQL
jgi:UDP-N-acetylmuramoylalanine--D-glutamate ligase